MASGQPSLGQRLRELREERGLSHEDVERLSTGVIRVTLLSNLESDRVKNPTAKHLQQLATLYTVDPGPLLELGGHRARVAEIATNANPTLTEPEKRSLARYIEATRGQARRDET